MNTFAWLIRREIWENRGIYVAPMIVGVLQILAALIGHIQIPAHRIAVATSHGLVEGRLGGIAMFATGWFFGVVMIIYSTFYLVDALYGDRKDRSILFWKSLPITDSAVVLSKLVTALLVIPAIFFAIGDLTGLISSGILSVRLSGAALAPGIWLQFQVLWLYLIIAMALWYLPIAGWLLLVSAWARRAVLFWVIFPPFMLAVVERMFFGSSILGRMLKDRVLGFVTHGIRQGVIRYDALPWIIGDGSAPTQPSVLDAIDLAGLLATPALWAGLLVGAGFVYGAIVLRRHRMD
jgi:ABC-2 type transport system permease protein